VNHAATMTHESFVPVTHESFVVVADRVLTERCS
jgi:hypothetical protein